MMDAVTFDAVPTPLPPSGARVLRPSSAAYGRAVKANLVITIPLLVISIARLAINPWLLPVFVVTLALVFCGVLLYFRNTRVVYADGSYTIANLLGVRRSFTAAQAKVLVTVTSLRVFGATIMSPQLLVVGDSGAKILRLRGQTWDVEQFTELANDLIAHGVTNDAIREPITAGALRDRYPRAVGWYEAHPIAWALLLAFGILIVIFAVAFAVVAAQF